MVRTRWIFATLLLSAVAWGANFKAAKLIDVHDVSQVGAAEVANSTVSGERTTSPLAGVVPRTQITLSLDGTNYTAVFPIDRHLKVEDLTVGETIMARVEGNKLVVQSPTDGKQLKAKISRRAVNPDKTTTE